MMEENREGLGMKVIAVMVQRYGVLPKELWDLNSISDMGAGRSITYDDTLSKAMFESITGSNRYSIINFDIGEDVSHKVQLPKTLRRLTIRAKEYPYPLDLLPEELSELIFEGECKYNQPLVLPGKLRKLVLNFNYNPPITLPLELVELELGYAYNHPLLLPRCLRRLVFPLYSKYNHPVTLPPSLVEIKFGSAYNQATILPSKMEEVEVGSYFNQNLSFPPSVRKIVWRCARTVQLPECLAEVEFSSEFNHPVALPSSLKKIAFYNHFYSHPVELPNGLEQLLWRPTAHEGLILPERLQKLTWGPSSSINVPLSLKELIIEGGAPLVLPDGLLKVTISVACKGHYNLLRAFKK